MRGRRPALIPGQGAAQGIGQGQDASGESVGDQIGAFALGQRDQQQEPGRASDQGDDRGHAFAEEQIALPVTRDCPVNAPGAFRGRRGGRTCRWPNSSHDVAGLDTDRRSGCAKRGCEGFHLDPGAF